MRRIARKTALVAIILAAGCGQPLPPAGEAETGLIRPAGSTADTLLGNRPAILQAPSKPGPLVAGDGAVVDTPLRTVALDPQRPPIDARPPPVPERRVLVPAPMPPESGDRTWAVETVSCEPPDEARVYLIGGRVTRTGSLSDPIRIRPDSRVYLYFDTEREGFDDTATLCTPLRRYCYRDIAFDAGGGSRFGERREATVRLGAFAGNDSRESLFALVERAVMDECGYGG